MTVTRARPDRGLGALAAGLAGAWTMLAAQPAAASTPAALCVPTTAPASAVTAPPAAALVRAGQEAEALLARRAGREAAEQALNMLDLSGAGEGNGDAVALAAYCAAAGEAIRLATSGSQAQAQTYLLAALRYARQAPAPEIVARAAYRLGLASVVAQASGDSRGARSAYRAAVTEPDALVRDAVATESDLCSALLQPSFLRGTAFSVSQEALECAADQARSAGQSEIAALAQLRLARLHLAAAQRIPLAAEELSGQARDAALAGIGDAAGIGSGAMRAELVGRLIETAIDAGSADAALLNAAIGAMRAAAPADPGVLAFAAALQGRLALAAGDAPAAAAALQQAVFLESQRPQPLRLSDWFLLLARAAPERRDELLMQAYRALESVRPLLPLADPLTEESTFELHMRPVFEAAVEVQFRAGAGGEELQRIAAAQEIVEAFRQAEIQSAFGSDCVPARDPIEPRDLAAGEILLYPILLRDRVELIFAARDADGSAPRYRRLSHPNNVGREAVARLVADMSYSVGYGSDQAWREPARQLYDLLIGPVQDRLGPNTTLVIVPDGPLRALPFAALLDANEDFLVERTQLSIAPALSYSQPGTAAGDDQPFVVAASLEKDVRLPAGNYPALAGADEEARVAAGVGEQRARGLFIEDFDRSDLSRALSGGRVDILHLATHAAFNGRSDRSFIVADGEAIPMAELRELISGSLRRGEEIDLLILSACETAVGDDQASMGLAGAAVQSGVSSAIASLWQVSDAGTVELMRNFYRFYRDGQGKAEALRNAQLALIESGGDLADPNIWAAFTLLGAWR